MILSDISYSGQLKIKQSKILIIGAGGIGAPAALYLAGMGVQNIGIIDGDKFHSY
jgi:adenylyltransferase/sulfurtransferase